MPGFSEKDKNDGSFRKQEEVYLYGGCTACGGDIVVRHSSRQFPFDSISITESYNKISEPYCSECGIKFETCILNKRLRRKDNGGIAQSE